MYRWLGNLLLFFRITKLPRFNAPLSISMETFFLRDKCREILENLLIESVYNKLSLFTGCDIIFLRLFSCYRALFSYNWSITVCDFLFRKFFLNLAPSVFAWINSCRRNRTHSTMIQSFWVRPRMLKFASTSRYVFGHRFFQLKDSFGPYYVSASL